MKIYVVGGAEHYANWISRDIEFVNNVKEADLIMLTGGPDCDPSIYGDEKNPKTYSNVSRDLAELKIFEECQELDKPMIGICKGSQTLTAFQPNGRVVQDVSNHASWSGHKVEFTDGSVMEVTSTHHQMMYPFNVEGYELLAWSFPRLSPVYEFGPNDAVLKELPLDKEPEVVFYPKTRCLCCQSHPEQMKFSDPFVERMRLLIVQKLKL